MGALSRLSTLSSRWRWSTTLKWELLTLFLSPRVIPTLGRTRALCVWLSQLNSSKTISRYFTFWGNYSQYLEDFHSTRKNERTETGSVLGWFGYSHCQRGKKKSCAGQNRLKYTVVSLQAPGDIFSPSSCLVAPGFVRDPRVTLLPVIFFLSSFFAKRYPSLQRSNTFL